MVRMFGVGARRERRLRLEGLEQRSLLSAGGLGLPVSEGVGQVPLQLAYNRSDWYDPQISGDDGCAAFSAQATLVPDNTNGVDDEYRVTIEPPATGSGFFVPRKPLNDVVEGPTAVITADVDGDGDMDVLTASQGDRRIAWYENSGDEKFSAHTITMFASGASSVFAADVDSDGDMDVLSASSGDNRIAWYENDGQEHFTTHTITDTAYSAESVFAADMDGDGDMDVLSASYWDSTVAWYENDGNQGFAAHTITMTALGARSVFAMDLDGDGDMDALSASDGEIAWYENDGNRGFTGHTITTSVDGAHSVFAADVDSDGDMDVLSASEWDDKVSWYENDGHENFAGRTVTSSADGAMSVFAKDVDGDGDTDVLAASFTGDAVAWYENDGNESFTARVIATSTDGAQAVWADDVDGDGDVDALSASLMASEVTWYENDGKEDFSERPLSVGEVHSGVPADLDGDGDLDVFSAPVEGKMHWFENDGGGQFSPHRVATSASGAHSLFAADMDGDGDTDLISASALDDRVLWHENDGNGNFTERTIASSAEDAVSVVAADMDGDGDMDVAAAFAVWGQGLAWYENQGSGEFAVHPIDSPAIEVNCVVSADLDGDGDMDLASSGVGNGTFVWHENDGEGNFTSHAIATAAGAVYALATADLDADGDVDLLSASWHDAQILWHENDGNGGFTSHTIASADNRIADSVFAADMDGDGDMDVLSATERWLESNDIIWYENDGKGDFTSHILRSNMGSRSPVVAGDMDQDGDLDVLGPYNGTIAWYEQLDAEPVDMGAVDYRILPGLDLWSGEKFFSFTTTRAGFVTVEATFDPSRGDVLLRLLDGAGNFVDEQVGIDGHARIDLTDLIGGSEHILQVSGNHPSVDVRICNLVADVQGIVTVVDTASADEFRYEYYEPAHYGPQHVVTINSIPYTFDLAEIEEVRFYGGGSVDRAVLAGSPGYEAVWFSAEASLVNYSATGFYLTVSGAADITVDGGGGNDTFELVDSSGDDQLKITPSQVTMTGLPVAGRLYTFTAKGFGDVQAYARAGGNDTAVMGTSEPGRVKVYPDSVKLMGADFNGRVKFFESTTVEMLSAKDSGVVSASTGVDALWAMKGNARIAYDLGVSNAAPAFDDLAYDVTILGCERLAAQASGGDDWVELHDSVLNDILIAKPHKTEMMNGPRAAEGIERGDEYEISARGFRNVLAIADQGGAGDAAKLYDSGELGVDVWAAAYSDGKTWSTMSSPNRRLYEVWGFEQVGGYGMNGGLGAKHGTNRKDHAAGTDFVFQYGYWEGGDPPTDPRHPRG